MKKSEILIKLNNSIGKYFKLTFLDSSFENKEYLMTAEGILEKVKENKDSIEILYKTPIGTNQKNSENYLMMFDKFIERQFIEFSVNDELEGAV